MLNVFEYNEAPRNMYRLKCEHLEKTRGWTSRKGTRVFGFSEAVRDDGGSAHNRQTRYTTFKSA